MVAAQEPSSPARPWSWLMGVLMAGVRPDDSATLRRKLLQANAGALISVCTVLVYNLAFWASGNPALISSGTWQLPTLLLAPLVWWLNARRRVVRARWLLILLVMVDVVLAMVGGQGTAGQAHLYYLLFAVLVPTILDSSERVGIAVLVTANLAAFVWFEQMGVRPHPGMAELPLAWRAGLTLSMLISCVAIAVLMSLLTEAAAAENEQRLQMLAGTDGLTGLPNRRRFLQALAREQGRIARDGGHLSIAIADLDHFKRINDEHGHAAGDHALVLTADCARRLLRPYDVVARVGGEEFALVLPDTSLDEAMAITERFRAALASQPVPLPDGAARLTVSVGVTQLQPGEALDEALRRADSALYRAKEAGRDRVLAAA